MFRRVGPFETFTFHRRALRELGHLNAIKGRRVAQRLVEIRDQGVNALPSSYRKNLYDVYLLEEDIILSRSIPQTATAVVQDIFVY